MNPKVFLFSLLGFFFPFYLIYSEGPSKSFSHGNPTTLEQYYLEMINKIRENPVQTVESIEILSSKKVEEKQKLPPLAFHPGILRAAQKHAKDMVENNYLSHTNRKRKSPTDRAKEEKYSHGVAENIFGLGAETIEDLRFIHEKYFQESVKQTKVNLKNIENLFNPKFTEIGIGIEGKRKDGKIVQKFGRDYSILYITGVVYEDKNENGQYDIGEGLEGVNVIPDYGDFYGITSYSGGYSIPIYIMDQREESFSVNTKGVKWSKEHKEESDKIRKEYLEDKSKIEWLEFSVTFRGGKLKHPRATPIKIKKPIKIIYKLVQSENIIWNSPKDDPLIIGENFKLDLSIPPIIGQ